MNQKPNGTQNQFQVAINNIFSTSGDQFDSGGFDSIQTSVHIDDLVNSHLGVGVVLATVATREDVHEFTEEYTTLKISADIFKLQALLSQMLIAPGCESLDLHPFPAFIKNGPATLDDRKSYISIRIMEA